MTYGRVKLRPSLSKLRSVVADCLAKDLISSAIFFADKLVSMSDGRPRDILLYARTLYFGGQYCRAVALLRREGLIPNGEHGHTGSYSRYQPCGNHDDDALCLDKMHFLQLAAQCLVAMKSWDECLTLLDSVERDHESWIDSQEKYIMKHEGRGIEKGSAEAELPRGLHAKGQRADGSFEVRTHRGINKFENSDENTDNASVSTVALLYFLRGKVYGALENRSLAKYWYKLALSSDPFCFEAFHALTSDHMLSPEEERSLLASLNIKAEDIWLHIMYRTIGQDKSCWDYEESAHPRAANAFVYGEESKKAHNVDSNSRDQTSGFLSHEFEAASPATFPEADFTVLLKTSEVSLARAERLFHRGYLHQSYLIISEALDRDPLQLIMLPCFLAVAVELRRNNDLYRCAHELVEQYPDDGISWFAVGCYYYCGGKFDSARRYFSKATSIENSLVSAWIGFGHAFAAQEESDQAMAAYRTAARLFPGCHIPLLCIGIEYQRTNNLGLAQQFLSKASNICPDDPFVCNELGVLAYRNKDYVTAVMHLEHAMSLLPLPSSARWEATAVNLAHAYRKQHSFEKAISWYEKALSFAPRSASTYTALGLTHQLKGNFQSQMSEAIECYHKALSLRPDDTFAQEMLTLALIDQCAVTMPPYKFMAYNPHHNPLFPPKHFSKICNPEVP